MLSTGSGVTSSTDSVATQSVPAVRATQTLTFLFTDVEGSTRLWEQFPDVMPAALERHDAILRGAIERSDGAIVKATGDGVMAVFDSAVASVAASVELQRALLEEQWPETCPISVRVGVHSGDAETRGGDFFGPTVNRTARIMAAGHGGQVLLSGSTAALVTDRLPDAVTLRDLGEHRLKDLERPERLFQLLHPDLVADFAPLATLDLRPNNLPTQTSAFVGRDREIEEISRRLADPAIRLLTLTGPGGTGKTRLALRVAADHVDRFANGAYFVDLVPARSPDSVIGLIASAIGIGAASDQAPLADVKRQLRSQEVLLVLDNFEQAVAAAPLLVELLRDCERLKLLVTSREALRVRGESLYSVPPLSLPGAASAAGTAAGSAAELGRFEAIQLFVERARAARADFHLTDDNAAAVAEICRRLDGLPLAIELATARINLFSPEALRDRLGSRLKALGSGPRDLPARQQTLRATIEWSYQLLDPAEQRLFEVLSVFAGAGFEAVEAVVSGLQDDDVAGLDVADGLSSLLDKSLLRAVEAAARGASGPRVVMLETIKEYAAERLAQRPEFADAVRERHAAHFADRAATAWRQSGEGTDAAVTDVDTDLENTRIAWRYWLGRGDDERLNQLLDPLWAVYQARGWYDSTIELIGQKLDVLATLPRSRERWLEEVTLRTSLARAMTLLRGYTGAIEDAYERALALFDDERAVPQLYPVLRGLLSFHGFRGEFDKSVGLATEILRLAEAQDDAAMRVDAHAALGSNLAFMGRPREGLEHLETAIAQFETRSYRANRLRLGLDPRVSSLTTSAFILWLLGNPDRAVARAARAISLSIELDHPYSLAYAEFHNGFLRHWRREPQQTRVHAQRVLEIVEDHDFPVWRALGMVLLGSTTAALGEPERGVAEIDDGLSQYQGLRTPPVFWPLVRYLQAGALHDAGRAAEGLALLAEAAQQTDTDAILAPFFGVLVGDMLLQLPTPDRDAAAAMYRGAVDLAVKYDVPLPQLRATSRLWHVTSPGAVRAEQVATLRRLYESMTEGRDTPDMRDAEAILETARP